MKKKILSVLLCTVMVCSMFAGCGNNNSGQQEAEVSGNQGDGTQNQDSQQDPQEAQEKSPEITTKQENDNTEKTEETLTVAIGSEPKVMYPSHPNNDMSSFSIDRVLYDRLVEVDSTTGEISPALATDWEWVDETHLKMNLRNDVVAADGTPFTANDVLFSLKTAEEQGSGIAIYFDFAETKVESDTCIVLGLKQADNGFLFLLGNAEFSLISESATEAVGGIDASVMNPLNGTGKYTFKEWKSGEYILCERNENYWDKDYNGYYKYIKFVFISDVAARVLAVQSGDADMAISVRISQAVSVQDDPNVDVIKVGAGMVNNVIFNCEEEHFQDVRVRQAVRYLIDPAALNQVQNLGEGKVQPCGLINSSHPYFYDVYAEGYAAEPREVNVEKAKALLAEAGYPDGFEFSATTMPIAEAEMTAYQGMLAEAGIKMNIEIVDGPTAIKDKREGKFGLTPCVTFGTSQGQSLFQNLLDSQIGVAAGSIRYHDEAWNELLNKACTTQDETELKGLYEQIQKQIYDDCLLIGSYEQMTTCVVKKGLVGPYAVLRTELTDVSDVRPGN